MIDRDIYYRGVERLLRKLECVEKAITDSGGAPIDYTALFEDIITNTASASLESTQLDVLTKLDGILTQLQAEKDFEETVWVDSNTNAFYIREKVLDQSNGTYTISWKDIDNNTATPTIANLVQTKSVSDFEVVNIDYRAIATGTGYAIDDIVKSITIVNTSDNSITTIWRNETQGTLIAAPTTADIQPLGDTVLLSISSKIDDTNSKLDTLDASVQELVADTTKATLAEQALQTTALDNIQTKQTDGTQKAQISNGTDSAVVTNTTPTSTDFGVVTRNIPSGTQDVQVINVPNVGGKYVLSATPIADGDSQHLLLDSLGNLKTTVDNGATKTLQEAQLDSLDAIKDAIEVITDTPLLVQVTNPSTSTATSTSVLQEASNILLTDILAIENANNALFTDGTQLTKVVNVGTGAEGSYSKAINNSTNALVTIKSTFGNVYGLMVFNPSLTTVAYFKMYNGITPVLGTTAPVVVRPIAPNSWYEVEPKSVPWEYFTGGIRIATTLNFISTDTTAPATPLYTEIKYI
jgi:hypothetical protein